MTTTKTLDCIVCDESFTYTAKGGRDRRFCSHVCRTARDTELTRQRRRWKKNGLSDYSWNLPGTGLRTAEMQAVRDATKDAWLNRRPSPAEVRAEYWEDDPEHDHEDPSSGESPDSYAEPTYPISIVRQVLDFYPAAPAGLADLVAPHDPPKEHLHGLQEITESLGFSRGKATFQEVTGNRKWDDVIHRDRERNPWRVFDDDTVLWLKRHAVPEEAFDVGRTGDITTGPGIKDPLCIGARESLKKPARFENWGQDEQMSFFR